MVWLHGGAFTFGAGSAPIFRGAALARRGDVVVVTVNYRLGIFGYLRGIDLCGDTLWSTGNEGLLDQMAALRWVKNQIAAFGGDPNNVTVFGQSAGALSIFAMLSMPQARGLFHKAILHSFPSFLHTPPTANHVTQAILNETGLGARDAGRLREMPAGELLDVQARATPRSRGGSYRPVVDGTEIPRDPLVAIADGSSADIPLLVGTNLEEHKRF
jgi:para-nitrobenzyl esterase